MSDSQPREQTDRALATLGRLLQPIVRFALGMGLKHAQIEEVLRHALLREGRRLLERRGGRPGNVSQLSVLTGLHRKDLTRRVADADAELPRTDASVTLRVFTRWLQLAIADPGLRRLPLTAPEGRLSFRALAQVETRGDVHFRSLLDDLVRLGVVRSDDGHAELAGDGVVPTGSLQNQLAFLGDNGRDHLLAATHNVLDGEPRFLERAVFTDGLTPEACEALQRRVRERWEILHSEIYAWMLDAETASARAGDQSPAASAGHPPPHRMRVGIFSYCEPQETTPRAASAATPSTPTDPTP